MLVHFAANEINTPKSYWEIAKLASQTVAKNDIQNSSLTCILVASVKSLEGYTCVMFGSQVGQVRNVMGAAAHGPVPGANDGVGNHEGDVVGVGPTSTFNCKCDVGKRHAVITYPDI